jgi:hypothetical protein
MPPPTRHRQLLTDAKWDRALGRQATIEDVLRFMVQHWTLLQRRLPVDMAFRNDEPRITNRFGYSLQKNALSAGLTGYFTTQLPVAKFGYDDEVETVGRTDIAYISDHIKPRIDLVFEFKKLKRRRDRRRDYVTKGIRRYVDGIYAVGQDVAFMVGLSNRPVYAVVSCVGII